MLKLIGPASCFTMDTPPASLLVKLSIDFGLNDTIFSVLILVNIWIIGLENPLSKDLKLIPSLYYLYITSISIMHGLDDKKSYHLPPTLPNPSARFSTLLSVRFFKLKDTGQWPPSCIYSCFGDGFKKCSVRYLEAPCKPTNRVVMLWWWWWW